MKYLDNVRINHKFNGLFFCLYFFYYMSIFGVKDSLIYAGISILIYAVSSAYFQPDLDQKINRPGRETFPHKSLVKHEQLRYVFYPINRAWFYLWLPYGHLFTHRGVSHWPIIGTYTRIFYLYPIIFIFPELNWFFSLFFSLDFSIYWVIWASPIFVSDIMHFSIDFLDSLRKNTPFCSFAQEPGILLQLVNPKAMKYHRKGLRGARKKNKKK